jgi:hypothetical protein
MSAPTVEAVVAGSKGFAIALLAPLTERVGVRPRIAADASQALGLLQGPNGIAVLEVQNDATVAAIESLLPERSGLRVIAAVPEALAGLEGRLRAAGAELARWDGKVLAVLDAVSRATEGAPASPVAPAAAPIPPPAAAAPPPRPPAPAAPAARPPGPPAAGPPRGPAFTPLPQAAAARPVAAPPASARTAPPGAPSMTPRPIQPGGGPALTPSRPMQPVGPPQAPRPAHAAPSHTPRPTQPPGSTPRPVQPAGPALTPSRPMQSVGPALTPPAPAPTARPPASVESLFDSLDADVDLGADAPAAPAALAAPAARAAPAAPRPPDASEPASAAWPAGGPSSEEAEAALARHLAGEGDPATPLGAVTALVAATLSDLERASIQGAPVPLDPGTFRRAAGLRLRVAAALAGLPAPGSAVDAAALSGLLGEIDALLSAVAAAAKEAPQQLMPSLEAVRNGLVKEAIDFSEAAQRIAPAGAQPEAEKVVRSARAAQARVLSVTKTAEAPERRPVAAWILLAAALLAGGGFHGYRMLEKRNAIAGAPSLPGQPAGLLLLPAVPGAPQSLVRLPGAHVDRAEIERFRELQRAKGYEVDELPSGELVVRRARDDDGAGR